MSYILEALRKVEQQRDQVQAHGLLSPRRYYGDMSAASMPRLLFVVGSVSGAVLSVALLIYLTVDYKYSQPPAAAAQIALSGTGKEHTAFLPDRRDEHFAGTQGGIPPLAPMPQPESSHQAPAREVLGQDRQEVPPRSDGETKPVQEKKPTSDQPAAPPRDQHNEVTAVHKAPRRNPVKEIAPHRAATPAPERLARADVTRTPQPQPVKKQPSPPVQATAPATAPSPVDETELPAVLPPQLQSIAPRLSIDGFVFSPDPTQRVVIINMKLYSEGQITPDGITVEAIRQNYVICSYQGQRFRLLR